MRTSATACCRAWRGNARAGTLAGAALAHGSLAVGVKCPLCLLAKLSLLGALFERSAGAIALLALGALASMVLATRLARRRQRATRACPS